MVEILTNKKIYMTMEDLTFCPYIKTLELLLSVRTVNDMKERKGKLHTQCHLPLGCIEKLFI